VRRPPRTATRFSKPDPSEWRWGAADKAKQVTTSKMAAPWAEAAEAVARRYRELEPVSTGALLQGE